jgi:putative peptide zinc metalloprotease protein
MNAPRASAAFAPAPHGAASARPRLSPEWYRVGGLRPRLRAGLQCTRQVARGQVWHVVTDPASGRHHRFNAAAWAVVGRCDGSRTLDELWQALQQRLGDAAPTQAEVMQVVGQAWHAGLVASGLGGDAAAALRVARRRRRRRWLAQVNPLAFKLPLWNPERWLQRCAPPLQALAHSRWLGLGLALAAAAVALAYLALLLQAGPLARAADAAWRSGQLLWMSWVAYPFIKALHEAAHALVCKACGGAVHEVGVSVLLLTPLPYVDASASSAFASKHQRAAVAAAGVVTEALIGAAALALWLLLEPGPWRDLCLAVALLGLVVAPLVNANPLMRFDGYHVLTDWLELPNLGSRSRQFGLALIKRRVLGLAHVAAPAPARGERPWLLLYAPLAWLWRVGLLLVLAAAALPGWPWMALLLATVALWFGLLGPLLGALRWSLYAPEAGGYRSRSLALLGGAGLALLAAALVMPVTPSTQAPALVWLHDDAQVRLGAEGRVERWLVADGQAVEQGAPLALLANDELRVEQAQAEAELQRLELQHRLAQAADDAQAPLRAALVEPALVQVRERLALLTRDVQSLTLRAPSAGRIVIDPQWQRQGQHLPQGQVVAQVLSPGARRVRAWVSPADIQRVQQPGTRAWVEVASWRGAPLPARAIHAAAAVPGVSLPSAALGQPAGGPLPVAADDPAGLTLSEPRFMLELELPAGAEPPVGARARVRFEHPQQGAGLAAWQWLQRLLRPLGVA